MKNSLTSSTNEPTVFSDSNWELCRKLLLELEEDLSNFLTLTNTTCLRVAIATYVANKLNSDPVWLLLIASPSAGKTEILKLLINLDDVFEVSTITEGALLSGTPKRETSKHSSGGLLREIGDYGFIIFKDFTSILQMNRDTQSQVTAALREVYDGRWTRWFGTDGGKHAHWKGKVGLIAAVTPAIEASHAITNTMGERFIMYRIHTDSYTRLEQARKALDMAEGSDTIRNELKHRTTELVKSIKIPEKMPFLSSQRFERFVILAYQVALCRSSVIRGYDRHIELVPEPESPPRIAKQLLTLFFALQLIGSTYMEAWEAICEVGFSSIPELRWKILKTLHEDSTHSIQSLASKIQQSKSSIRRKLEEMENFGIVEKYKEDKKDIWRLTETVSDDFDVLFPPSHQNNDTKSKSSKFSEMSVDPELINTDTLLTFRESSVESTVRGKSDESYIENELV